MRRPIAIKAEEESMKTIVSLTSAFESMSSMKIMQTKKKVLISNEFFNEVWNIYKQIRVDSMFNFGRETKEAPIDKEVLVLIMAPSGLMGDIDQRLIKKLREYYDSKKHDIIVVGRHGAMQLSQVKIQYKRYFDLPKGDYINISPLVEEIKMYSKSHIFYQSYVSLSEQLIKSLDISEAISSMGKVADMDTLSDEEISDKTYIFEPSTYAVASYLETAMLRLMITQFIYDSRLAQLASRFKAMSAAKERSTETMNDLHLEFNRSKRATVDKRLKESLASLKKIRAAEDS